MLNEEEEISVAERLVEFQTLYG
jgi:hypothetical protein